ncbi:MAG: type II CAAX endopeptidase family protein [Oscillospiraceae bacterium]|nr:type II CAAX endopeptidase family protein [Oscillospiraceae bacterium]
MKVVIIGFFNTMTKPQKIAGLIYLPFHIFIIPFFLGMAGTWLPGGLNDLTANIIYYAVGFAFCLIVMWKYLRNAFDIMLDNPAVGIAAIIFGFFLYFLLSYLAIGVLLMIIGDSFANPNNEALKSLTKDSLQAALGLAVFIAPIVEEVLFRGVVFGSLRPKHRVWAFVISTGLFALYHVWQYALLSMDWRTLLYAIEYIPAGYALAWTYEKTNSIWIPIFLHTFINIFSSMLLG